MGKDCTVRSLQSAARPKKKGMKEMAVNKNKDEKKITVMIPKPKDTTGDTETTVIVNGVMYQVQYDRPVEVPEAVAEVIQNSNKLNEKLGKLEEAEMLGARKSALYDY